MPCPIVVATIGTCGEPVASSSKSAQTASAPPSDDLPLPRGVARIADVHAIGQRLAQELLLERARA